jgi:hypothetical protein
VSEHEVVRSYPCDVVAVFMMIAGPLLGAAGGALGGAVATDHPRRPRSARSWSAGLFVSHW